MDLFKVTGNDFRLNVPLTKVDARTGEFEGWATVEQLDRSNEIIDLEKSWPYFEALADKYSAATDGESFGPVREQHDAKKAAGKLIARPELRKHDSGAMGVFIKGRAIDAGTKEKLIERVLVGISIGGSYVEKAAAPDIKKGATRFVANPNEYTLCDVPCVDDAMITVVKTDGTETLAKALGFQPAQFWGCRDDAHRHVTKSAARDCDGRETSTTAEVNITKSLYNVSALASLLSQLLCIANDEEYEEMWESMSGDGETGEPDLSAQLKAVAQNVFDALEAMVADERAELSEDMAQDMAMAAIIGHLKKSATAKQLIKSLRVPSGNGSNSTTKENDMDAKEVQQLISAAVEPLAKQIADLKPADKAIGDDTLAKGVGEAITKAVSDGIAAATAPLATQVGNLEKGVEQIQGVVLKMFGMPAKTTTAVREVVPVAKADDGKPVVTVLAAEAKPATNEDMMALAKKAMVGIIADGPKEFGVTPR